MMHLIASLSPETPSAEATPNSNRITRDGCWKKPMNPKYTDWQGNVHPMSSFPDRRHYHEDGAPAAELGGREDLW
ncbi:MAG: hypothetical protein HQL76_08860 [Magnetococcales bacterium]|nr:hypothetical protein [Magnetococcales bacterium]